MIRPPPTPTLFPYTTLFRSEEVPDIAYEDVGGLDSQIEQIADAVELPFLHQELFAEHKLPAPKGILLYGPPGDRKSTRLNSSHGYISYAVFCLKTKRHALTT